MEYQSGRSGYEVASDAKSSLRRFKTSMEYRALLRRTIQQAGAEERGAKTHLAKARVRLQKFEAETELADIEAGGAPSAFHGLIALHSRE